MLWQYIKLSNYNLYYFAKIITVSTFTYRFWYAPFQVLRRAGIRGPRPTVIVGNMPEIKTKVSFTNSVTVVHQGVSCV